MKMRWIKVLLTLAVSAAGLLASLPSALRELRKEVGAWRTPARRRKKRNAQDLR